VSSFPSPGPGDRPPGRTRPARTRTAKAALACSAAVAIVLTGQLATLIIAYLTFKTPPDVEGPSAFIALMSLAVPAMLIVPEALAAWLAFAGVVWRFPRGSVTMIAVQSAIISLHTMLTLLIVGLNPWPRVVGIGAVVPLSIATVILFSRATQTSAKTNPR